MIYRDYALDGGVRVDRLAPLMQPSTLSRLFVYAKGAQNVARENFTTEALAGAVRHDPAPLVALFRDACVVSAAARFVKVLTQMNVPNVGQIDMVVVFDGSEVWVEVKVDAPESGNQLSTYLKHVATTPTTKLVTLAKASLHPDVVPLTWQQLRRAIVASGSTSPYWSDFRTYLEEIRVADAFDEPISSAERAALGPAHALLRKVARMLVPVAEAAASMVPHLGWRVTEPELLKEVTSKLRAHGVMSVSTRAKLRAGISFGAYPDDGDTGVGVWVWSYPSATAVRRQLLDAADAGKLPIQWERSPVEWEALGVYRRLSDFADHEAAATWLVERLGDLERAGLMRLIPALGLLVAGEDEGSDDD